MLPGGMLPPNLDPLSLSMMAPPGMQQQQQGMPLMAGSAGLLPDMSGVLPSIGQSDGDAANALDSGGWTEHKTKEGRRFWHHAAAGKSTWDKPDALKSDMEKLLATQTPWKEYSTNDGRVYWYNRESKQSVWNMPAEIQKIKEEVEAAWVKFTDKPTALEKLKLLYKLKGVGLKTKWEETLNLIKADSRFELLSILTNGEKKQAFAEYQSQLQKQEKERSRIRRIEARDLYLDALGKWPKMHPTKVCSDFESEHRKEWWCECLDSREREDLFSDFMEDYEAKYRELRRQERTKLREELTAYLISDKNRDIPYTLRWSDAKLKIKETEEFSSMDLRDILHCWEEFVAYGEKKVKEEEVQWLNRERRLRREAFKELLEELVEAGKLHAKSIWPDLVASDLKGESPYLGLVGVPLSTPRELFEDRMAGLIVDYEDQKLVLKRLLKTLNIKVTAASTFASFWHALQGDEGFSALTETNGKLFFDSLKKRALRRELQPVSPRVQTTEEVSERPSPTLSPKKVNSPQDEEKKA